MQILITGANGQLGNEINRLKEDFPQWNFLFTDVDTLDITNEISVQNYFEAQKVDFVVNCAAYTAVDKAESDYDLAHRVNALAPQILARQSQRAGARFIHVSTDYVFAGDACEPYAEEDSPDPQGVYGKTKLEGEQLAFKENPNTVVLRTAWLYSAFGNNFVKTMLRLGTERDELKVVFDQIGSPTYAADLAKAILHIIERSARNAVHFIPGIYHFTDEGVASWFDFALTIFELANVNCKVVPVLSDQFPTPAKRPHYSVLNKSKVKTNFELNIPYWKDSLKECIKELRDK